ncbi:MAG TPA: hypothetical protein VK116_13410, partial [Planctomycetota bacterium]|nr:hypothetical protein [Planctomycetota bacterium]
MSRAGALVAGLLVATIVVLFFLPGEKEARAQTPLARAVEMVRRASSESFLRRNGVFLAIDVPHDVEHWVEFFFSPL